MNEAEVLEQLNLFADNAMNSYALYLTLTFSYLTAFYVAGAQLSKLQATIISLLYFSWALTFSLVATTHIASFESLLSRYPNFVPSIFWQLPWLYLGGVIAAGGILASCYFAFDIRRNIERA